MKMATKPLNQVK